MTQNEREAVHVAIQKAIRRLLSGANYYSCAALSSGLKQTMGIPIDGPIPESKEAEYRKISREMFNLMQEMGVSTQSCTQYDDMNHLEEEQVILARTIWLTWIEMIIKEGGNV